MLGALLFFYVTLDDPKNPGMPLYPPPCVYRWAAEAGPETRQQFVEAAIRAGLTAPRFERLSIDGDEFLGVIEIIRGRAIGRRVPGDPAWK